MRVAIFVWGVEGSFANVAAGLSKGLLDRDVDVEVVYVHEGANPQESGFPQRAKLTHLGPRRTILAIPALARYLREQRPDVLISLSWIQNAPAIVAKTMSRWSGTLILNEASSMTYKSKVEHRNDVRLRHMPSVARLLYPRAQGLVVPSRDVLEDLEKNIGFGRRGPRLRVIANPVDVEDVRARAAKEPENPDLIESSCPLILGVGRLARQKNFGLLIRAFARVRQQRPARLLLLGAGPQRQQLQELATSLNVSEYIQMPGRVHNPFSYMARADVFALSSEEEGFGLVLVEAMASGVPVVATDCPGGPSEILEEGKSGIMVPLNDVAAMAAGLTEVLEDESRGRALVAAGYRRAEDFKPERIAAEWLAFVEEIANAA